VVALGRQTHRVIAGLDDPATDGGVGIQRGDQGGCRLRRRLGGRDSAAGIVPLKRLLGLGYLLLGRAEGRRMVGDLLAQTEQPVGGVG
jgi:hypothetical protein